MQNYAIITGFMMFLPLMVGIMNGKLLRDEGFKCFKYFLFACLLIESASFLHVINGISNHYLLNLFVPFEFGILAYTISMWFEFSKARLLVRYSIGSFALFWAFVFISGLGVLTELNSLVTSIENILLGVIASCYLVSFMSNVNSSPSRSPRFWIAGGIFIFNWSTLIINASSELLLRSDANSAFANYFIYLYCSFNAIAYIFYTIALLCKSQNKGFSF